MEDITLLVSHNLRRIREEKKLSLDKLAEMTGVSKSMLGQIERGDSSPTISVVWKIANGLKISFTSLLSAPQSDTQVVPKSVIQPMLAEGGRYRLYPVFPIEEGRRFEVYFIELDPGTRLSSDPHSAGTREFITISRGQLLITLDEVDYPLAEGDSITFRADRPHAYRNPGEIMATVQLVIHYPD